ncbi:MAG: hypothetical protein PHT77_12220 [Bacteroidales bacterium]|nr:hypothetical protein [Bacteroidales bacterium]MDD3962612.1 hypothetical protein [Bacteroidales bacterium]MDY0139274.1 hypothetical protein [Candidatus Izemoplasmatales bacterium]
MSYIIYHPKRDCSFVKTIGRVYHDSLLGNQDPYIWNYPFLHSFCHITQITKQVGQVNFWCTGDTYPNFEKLYCDLVFKVASMHEWADRNSISETDTIVDNKQSYEHHYKWVRKHLFMGTKQPKKRITLKACKDSSFQPQNEKQELIDIVPFLSKKGIHIYQLRSSISFNSKGNKAFPSRPFKLDKKISKELYEFLFKAKRKLYGCDLKDRHPNNE